MRPKNVGLILCLLLLLCPAAARAQQKLLTVEDIYDPVKKVSFSGPPAAERTWLADGEHYLESVKRGDANVLMKVNARTGGATPFFDAARMTAALSKIQGVSAEDAKSLAQEESYKLNRAQTAVLLKAANDLVYYELNSDAAVRLTNDAEELCRRMLVEAGVAATPGVDFDADRGHRYVRFSYAGSDAEVAEAARRLRAWRR